MRDNFNVHEWNINKIREEKNISGDEAVTKTIEFLRKSIYPKLTDDEMDKFVVGICEFMDCTPPSYRLNEKLGVSKDKLSNIVKFVGAVNFSQMVISLRDENVQDEIVSAFEGQYPAVMDKRDDLQEGLNEDEGTLNKISDMLSRKFNDLKFDINTTANRIDVRGSQQDLMNFGSKSHGKKIYDYEIFHTDDDDRGEIVRIVKSDSISRG